MKLPRITILCAALALAHAAQAQSLLELVDSARAYDAAYQSARAQYDATLARAEQARSAVLPTIGLGASMSRTNQDVTIDNVPGNSTRSFGTNTLGLNATQPLYRPANWASYEQGRKQADLASAQLNAAEQDLIVRVSQAYFDVLAAQDSLTFVKAQKSAVSEQLASAKRNFEVGTATITDTREAQARFDLVTAQEIATENDLRVKRLALDQLVGKTGTEPKALRQPLSLPALDPADVEAWVQRALAQNPNIAQARVGLDVADLEVSKAQAGHKPTVDVTASYSMVRSIDGSSSAAMGSRANVGTIGINLSLPLFAGYAIQNRVKETLALQEKARSDLENASRSVAQGTRTAYFGVLSGQGQVKALEAAEASSLSALDANKLGYQVGVRINIDVLNAQSQLFDTKAKLAKARYDVLVGGLRLRQAVGSLSVSDLAPISALLAP